MSSSSDLPLKLMLSSGLLVIAGGAQLYTGLLLLGAFGQQPIWAASATQPLLAVALGIISLVSGLALLVLKNWARWLGICEGLYLLSITGQIVHAVYKLSELPGARTGDASEIIVFAPPTLVVGLWLVTYLSLSGSTYRFRPPNASENDTDD